MKNSLITVTLAALFSTSAAFAHHPAADRVDPEIYAMIDENVADTPHADLVLDDMGSAMEAAGAAAGSAQMEAMSGSREINSELAADMGDTAGASVDTMDLMDNVVSALAE